MVREISLKKSGASPMSFQDVFRVLSVKESRGFSRLGVWPVHSSVSGSTYRPVQAALGRATVKHTYIRELILSIGRAVIKEGREAPGRRAAQHLPGAPSAGPQAHPHLWSGMLASGERSHPPPPWSGALASGERSRAHTQVLGFLQASIRSNSRLPGAGWKS